MSKALNVIDKFEDLSEQGFIGAGSCRCPRCGHNQPHLPGQPCRLKNCPKCNIPMARTIKAGESLEEAEKTVGDYFQLIRNAIMAYAPKHSNPNFAGIALQAMEPFEKKLLSIKDKSDPESLKTLLKALPDFFTTSYHDAEIPEFCLKYSIPTLNKVAKDIAKNAGVQGS